MNKNFFFYPTLDADQISEIEPKIDMYYSYFLDGMEVPIPFVDEQGKFISFDSQSNFDAEENDLNCVISISMKNIDKLYGPEGIAPSNGFLSIALECFSQKAKYRKVIQSNKLLNPTSKAFSHKFELKIPKDIGASEIKFSILVFLDKPAKKMDASENFLNNAQGVVLGSLFNFSLYLEGEGSLFPVYTISSKDKKLWSVEINYEDPAVDQLEESVKLKINSGHKDYALLNPNDKKYCDRLINEIMASALTILITQLREEGFLEHLDGNCVDGSILQFVTYMKDVLNIDFTNIINISSSLREYLDGEE